MDENQDTKALQENAEEQVSDSTTPVEEPTATEEATDAQVDATADTGEEETETVESSHKGAESRIRELNAKAKSAESRARSLEEQLAELTGRDRSYDPTSAQSYQPQVEPGQEITREQYGQDILRTAQSMVDLQIKQNNAVNRINNEAIEVMREYPELDPENEAFDQELSDSVTEATLSHVRANPYSASPKKFVSKMMQPYRRAVTKQVGKASENLARQVSQAAQRPTAVTKKGEKDYSEMSIKELEETLGISY